MLAQENGRLKTGGQAGKATLKLLFISVGKMF